MLGQQAGFALAGIAPIPQQEQDYPELDHFEPWVERGAAGDMEYLKRRDAHNRLLRSSLRVAAPWARSVIVCAANYNAEAPKSIDPAPEGAGWIARYAWTGFADQPTDYHDVLLTRLHTLEKTLQEELGPFTARCYVDTGPLVERVYARYAGIGWIGKNTCILNQQLGSWLLLGVILTDLTLPELADSPADRPDGEPLDESNDEPMAALAVPPDRCGSCTRCIDACPTNALTPYQMDASLCIAYLTIEKKGPIDPALRPHMGRQVFGCDICQDVCPWNRRAPASTDPQLAVRPPLVNPELAWLGEVDAESFRTLFRKSPLQRTKLGGLLRNVAIAMGNSGSTAYLPKLRAWATGSDPVLAEAAQWAMEQLEAASLT